MAMSVDSGPWCWWRWWWCITSPTPMSDPAMLLWLALALMLLVPPLVTTATWSPGHIVDATSVSSELCSLLVSAGEEGGAGAWWKMAHGIHRLQVEASSIPRPMRNVMMPTIA